MISAGFTAGEREHARDSNCAEALPASLIVVAESACQSGFRYG
jgi:hypothetical protein